MGSKIQSDFLYSSPSLISGTARLLDWYGQFDQYNTSADSEEADLQALFSDWAMVGNDLVIAMETFDLSSKK